MTPLYCYISKKYYDEHPDLVKILDLGMDKKYGLRTHLCLSIKYDGNTILIPLRKNLGNAIRPFGTIGFSVPSNSMPNAGLDYRYIMIINDNQYLSFERPKIPNSQTRIISKNYPDIEKQATTYIKEYVRCANKNRINKTAKFRESSLINFHKELHIKINNKESDK